MSLMDAMLLEGYRDPREVYIALRTDGLKGSGTIDDPYDGGVREGAAFINNLLLDRKVFLVLTGGAQHRYVAGQTTVQISGDGYGNFNGSYSTFEVLTATCLKITLAAVPGAAPRIGNSITAVGNENSFAATLSYSGTQITVTKAAHNYSEGDNVEIAGITNTNNDWVNGTFPITYVNANQFRYTNKNASGPVAPTAPAQGSPTCKRIFASIAVRLVWPVVKMTASQATGYSELEIIRLQGTTNPSFDGDRQIVGVGNTSFWFEALPNPASDASISDVACCKLHYRFDETMRSLGEGSGVSIGAGVFETRGFDPSRTNAVNWSIRSGQTIHGSGIGVTTLKLVHASPYWPNPQLTYAIGHGAFSPPYIANLDNARVSDLMVDCNMRSHLAERVSKAAVALKGSHVRIQRVKAVDYGTHVPAIECFVFSVASADPRDQWFTERRDCRIEDCILEHPSLHGLYTNTCSILSSGESPASSEMGYHRGSAIRDNYVNNEYVDAPVAIASIQYQGGAWVVTTRAPHGRENGQWVIVSGAVDSSGTADTEGRSIHFNGTFQVSGVSPSTPDQFQITPAGSPSTSLQPVGGMWVGRFFGHRLPGKRLDLVSTNPPVAKMTTYIPHNKKPGDWVNVDRLSYSPEREGQNPYYGRFLVVSIGATTPTQLYYQLDAVPTVTYVDDDSGVPLENRNMVVLGVHSIGFSTDGGSEAVAEGNAVFHTTTGGSYHDTWRTKDQTDRNNYYSDVIAGPQQSVTGHNDTGATFYVLQAASAAKSGTTVTFNTTNPHGLAQGQGVYIQPDIGPNLQKYFAVSTVPSSNAFTIEVPGIMTIGSSYTFAPLWQVGLAIRERNLIEIGQVSPLSRTWGPPTGIVFYTGAYGDQFLFRKTICRDNHVSLPFRSQNVLAEAFSLNVESGLVEANWIELVGSNPWIMSGLGRPWVQQNLTPQGTLQQPAAGMLGDDISTRIQDALLLAL